jgi:hypothetical protein
MVRVAAVRLRSSRGSIHAIAAASNRPFGAADIRESTAAA